MLSPWFWALVQNLRFQLFSTFFYFRFFYKNGWWGNVKAFLKERKKWMIYLLRIMTIVVLAWTEWNSYWPPLLHISVLRELFDWASRGNKPYICKKIYIFFYILFYVFDWASRGNKPYICKHTVLVLSAENAFWMHRHLFGHAAATASSKTRHNKYFATIMPKNRKSSKLNVNTTIIYRTRTVSH